MTASFNDHPTKAFAHALIKQMQIAGSKIHDLSAGDNFEYRIMTSSTTAAHVVTEAANMLLMYARGSKDIAGYCREYTSEVFLHPQNKEVLEHIATGIRALEQIIIPKREALGIDTPTQIHALKHSIHIEFNEGPEGERLLGMTKNFQYQAQPKTFSGAKDNVAGVYLNHENGNWLVPAPVILGAMIEINNRFRPEGVEAVRNSDGSLSVTSNTTQGAGLLATEKFAVEVDDIISSQLKAHEVRIASRGDQGPQNHR